MASPTSSLSAAFIVASGNIGAGKSTLVERLAAHLGSPGILESHEKNPYLKPFYRDPARWAFHTQAGFLSLSTQDYQAIESHGGNGVLERTLDEHHTVFATQLHSEGVLSANEFEILERLHSQASADIPVTPAVVVYLQAPAEELLRRIRTRAGDTESSVSLDYLAALNQRYDRFAAEWSSCPIVAIDTTAVDIRTDEGVAAVAAQCAEARGRQI